MQIISLLVFVSACVSATQIPFLATSESFKSSKGAPDAPRPKKCTKVSAHIPLAEDQRVVAIGDLHGDYDAFVETLRMMKLISSDSESWIGGNTILVQTGDIADRGPYPLKIWDLVTRLRHEALSQGGRVVPLLGNHEISNLLGKFEDVSAEENAMFGGKEKRVLELSKHGKLGKMLRKMVAIRKVGDTVFSHGSLISKVAAKGIKKFNRDLHRWLKKGPHAEDKSSEGVLDSSSPLMDKFYKMKHDDNVVCPEVEKTLEILKAKRLVMGHVKVKGVEIVSRCDGKLFLVDIGISRWNNNRSGQPNPGALEIINGRVRAFYPNKEPVTFQDAPKFHVQ